MVTTGVPRPGGRTAAVRTAVLDAASELIVESGLGGLELTVVADRAGVGRSTVYRRWGSIPALVADLLHDMAETSVARADTGSLRGDLHTNAELVFRTLADARAGALFTAIIAAATFDVPTSTALTAFYRRRLDEWTPCVDDAVRRGEAPAGTDASAVIKAVSAPLYYQLLVMRSSPTSADATRSADAVLAAVEAGVFVMRGGAHPGSGGVHPGTAVP